MRISLRPCAIEESYHRHNRPLRERRERPRHSRAAEQRDEYLCESGWVGGYWIGREGQGLAAISHGGLMVKPVRLLEWVHKPRALSGRAHAQQQNPLAAITACSGLVRGDFYYRKFICGFAVFFATELRGSLR